MSEPPTPPRGAEPAPRTYLPAIQGLRGLAALSVLLVHLYLMPLSVGLWSGRFPDGLLGVLGTGGRGVELFFVISGYLIPASLRRHGSVGRFFYERALRILPLFVILHLVVFAVGPWIGYKFLAGIGPLAYAQAFLANLTFVAPLVDMPLAQQNAWSLTYEWLFYAWTALAALAWGGDRSRHLAMAILVAGAVLVAWHFPAASYFGLGLAFSRLGSPRGGGRVAGLALGLASLAAMYGLCEYVSVFAGLPFAAILFALVLDPGSGFAGLLRGRVLQYLGRVSYSLYLVHPFVLFGLLAVGTRLGLAARPLWAAAPLVFGVGARASALAAGITYELVERRLRGWLERLCAVRPAAAGRPAPPPHPREAEAWSPVFRKEHPLPKT
ncbi:acyltransferase [Methylobacterium sp. NEAU 140]|uniref:acyltransferase family protein n=1 Tax=Methylobacterium sp. NEAU 140 TaxID=3064945 RepID=UPI0027363655|nr:acyltransferase [Methylobacterium sp. NEAU 140]MDP4021786.1 acyltransferase [Methylobacterium sp. NEAU 140]